MDYRFSINFEGQVYLATNGAANSVCRLEATGSPPLSTDLWRLQAQFGPGASGGAADNGSMVLTGPTGGSLLSELQSGAPTVFTDESGDLRASTIDLVFAVREGEGRFEGATGTVRLYGSLESGSASVTADLALQAPAGVWEPPAASTLSPAEAASGASPQGPEPLSQQREERAAERSIIRGSKGGDDGPGSLP